MLKTKKIINLSGKMSILGVSKLSNAVLEAMHEASKNFYLIANLKVEVEANIARKFNSEAAFVTASASSAIVQSIFALKNQLLKKGLIRPVKVLLPLGHHIDYGAKIVDLIKWAGGEIMPLGASNHLNLADLEASLDQQADLAFYVSSHHCVQKNHLDYMTFANFYKKHKVLTAIDIAAEEDIWKFATSPYDLLIVSGAKAIGGPASGFVLTKQNHLLALQATNQTIGRAMKVTKEMLVGLNQAVNDYQKIRQLSIIEQNIEKYRQKLVSQAYEVSIVVDQKRQIPRLKIASLEINKIVKHLQENGIFTRNYYQKNGFIELDLRQVSEKEMEQVIKILKEVK